MRHVVELDHPGANGPPLLLADHHEQIEAACRAVAAASYGDDHRELIRRYRLFERAVLDHLAAEENEILPAYAEEDPEDAVRIRRQHGALRAQLYRLGVEVEVHCMTAHAFADMCTALRAHARYEDSQMYPWAQSHLPVTTRRRLLVPITHSLRRLTLVDQGADGLPKLHG